MRELPPQYPAALTLYPVCNMTKRILRGKLDEQVNMIHVHCHLNNLDSHLITYLRDYLLAAFTHISN